MNFEIQSPDKMIYKFNEVTSITGVKPYVLRFWETEFKQINPNINEHGQKIYRPEDIKIVQQVKKLLFVDKLSIPEAKLILNKESSEHNLIVSNSQNIDSCSEILKAALEQIIEKKSIPSQSMSLHDKAALDAYEMIPLVKQLSDKDVNKLSATKEKLCVLLEKIDKICCEHSWK